ncbi:MAG: triose-phosphate isomerase [Candidatus Woesearchaeota archaeon]
MKYLHLPVLIINFKTYKQGTGKNAEKLAMICAEIAKKTKKSIAIAVQPSDIYRIAHKVHIPVFSQHMDPVKYGANTGHLLPEDIKENGAIGVLLNHSEDQIPMKMLYESIKRARELELISLVCANTPETAERIARYKPDIIAVEPPELIGGDISVSNAKPEVITKTIKKVHKVKKIPVLCGAGVKTKDDIKKAIKLGSRGVLLASGIVLAKNPAKLLKKLVSVM